MRATGAAGRDGARRVSGCRIEIVGAGVAGLCAATLFAARGCEVTLRAASAGPDPDCCSWWAGGMLAPWCETESAPPLIATLGLESMAFWRERTGAVVERGSLVLAGARDRADLRQFAARTREFVELDGAGVAALEPALEGRFERALHFPSECHLDPRAALGELVGALRREGRVRFELGRPLGREALVRPPEADWRVDCRGLAARDALPDLRGVRGEMLLLRAPGLGLSRPVRLLHPRYPLYVVPRADEVYMVGATMIESDDRGHASARSVMELLSAAYALHPGFGEASVLEIGVDARPAFRDNLPRLRRRGRTLYLNGLYRHGFLCAPAMARRAVELALDDVIDPEVTDEHHP